jgi:hypothetical protein
VSDQLRTASPEYPLAVICGVLDLPRSSVYARGPRCWVDDEEQQVRAHLERIAGQWPT